jgi:hypothetical protein
MMKPEYCQMIRTCYQNSRGDSTRLFETMAQIATETGWDEVLAFLEKCVIEKRTDWLERNGTVTTRTEASAVMDGFQVFYSTYLGLSVPEDGEIIEVSERRIVSRWWNKCPTLDACQKLGLDTREICRKVYQQPVQTMMERIDPRLRFDRNYDAIRPYAPYCEEIIELVSEENQNPAPNSARAG